MEEMEVYGRLLIRLRPKVIYTLRAYTKHHHGDEDIEDQVDGVIADLISERLVLSEKEAVEYLTQEASRRVARLHHSRARLESRLLIRAETGVEPPFRDRSALDRAFFKEMTDPERAVLSKGEREAVDAFLSGHETHHALYRARAKIKAFREFQRFYRAVPRPFFKDDTEQHIVECYCEGMRPKAISKKVGQHPQFASVCLRRVQMRLVEKGVRLPSYKQSRGF